MSDSSKIRFINSSTSLPIDDEIESKIHSVLTSELSAVLPKDSRNRRHTEQSIDVIFVSALNLYDGSDEKKDNEDRGDHPDLLGVYYPCHSKYGRSIIQVSPEKIMDASVRLKKHPGVKLPLEKIFPALTIAVVIHEIAHWLMDDHDSDPGHRMCWKWLADLHADDQNRAEDYIQDMLKREFPECRSWYDRPQKFQLKVVEESLANAIMLNQHWSAPDLKVLELFVKNSPPEYAAGLNWKLSGADLIVSAEAWRCHKEELKYKKWFGTLLPINGSPLQVLSSSLSAFEDITSSVEFKCTFLKFVEESLSEMKVAWEKDKAKYDDMLNGTFGVFDWLCTQAWRKQCNLAAEQLASTLDEWSKTGATGKMKSEEFRKLHGL